MTIEQMAEQLGVSKSTVSRALSGKGRIGKETRERVLALAGSEERKKKKVPEKTGNIAVVCRQMHIAQGESIFMNV